MKNVGYLLITIGFLVGAYSAVELREGVSMVYLPALIAGAIGVAMVRVARRQAATRAETIRTNLGVIDTSLSTVVEKVRHLDETKGEIDVYELRHIIDREFPDDLDAFVQARYSLVHSFGLQQFADVMNPFSAGERYLNRVWSASVDGYIDECHTYVVKAREQFEEALEVFRGLKPA